MPSSVKGAAGPGAGKECREHGELAERTGFRCLQQVPSGGAGSSGSSLPGAQTPPSHPVVTWPCLCARTWTTQSSGLSSSSDWGAHPVEEDPTHHLVPTESPPKAPAPLTISWGSGPQHVDSGDTSIQSLIGSECSSLPSPYLSPAGGGLMSG